ncbi:hypothetical protein CAPTEDRAFT_183017 [Capitella teleta]|uniref:TFIIS N-terminal domain-containing protein n=1 Tax=Capitella teleta TaxID=283909 RepID=R7VFW2_CAPTE|nr:hypothetical protein CAPTEDRAFT_183017 [Capitella teleta]|eukprot:ELU17462.1 hypothetical protein CAPTEDRAFT_183017 [Capitella teleta]
MMARKKEEQGRRRKKRKNVDIINDSDDLIMELITQMKEAAEEDRELNQQKQPAIKKLRLLTKVNAQLKKSDLHHAFLDCGILNGITEWLAPLPDRSLPHLTVRESLLKHLLDFPPISSESLKMSGIGKAVMYLYKHPRETRQHKEFAGKLINEWSRPIFNLTSNYKTLTREEREQRDYEQLPKRRRLSLEGANTPRRDLEKILAGKDKNSKPGMPGFIQRARVPQPSKKDYVIRPKWNIDEQPSRSSMKKELNKYEKHQRAFAERKKNKKQQRAVPISVEGKNMAL